MATFFLSQRKLQTHTLISLMISTKATQYALVATPSEVRPDCQNNLSDGQLIYDWRVKVHTKRKFLAFFIGWWILIHTARWSLFCLGFCFTDIFWLCYVFICHNEHCFKDKSIAPLEKIQVYITPLLTSR